LPLLKFQPSYLTEENDHYYGGRTLHVEGYLKN